MSRLEVQAKTHWNQPSLKTLRSTLTQKAKSVEEKTQMSRTENLIRSIGEFAKTIQPIEGNF